MPMRCLQVWYQTSVRETRQRYLLAGIEFDRTKSGRVEQDCDDTIATRHGLYWTYFTVN
jgi:hypothetical protein